VKKAYRILAARYHPDKHQDNELADLAKEKLAEINEAFGVLKDEIKRAAYDRERAAGRETVPSSVPVADPLDQFGAIIRSFVRIFIVLAIVFFAMRFIRSPRALLVIGVAILVAWFLPRIIRKLKG
jgi:preprotein translocase subunit Sec63